MWKLTIIQKKALSIGGEVDVDVNFFSDDIASLLLLVKDLAKVEKSATRYQIEKVVNSYVGV